MGGRIDKVYFSPYLAKENHPTRKPNTGMALLAQKDFTQINFTKSIIVGDSISDMEFGRKVGMKTIFISNEKIDNPTIDYTFKSLLEFSAAF
jgi:HAD superfamily hydrolase (TIGR01662 family)